MPKGLLSRRGLHRVTGLMLAVAVSWFVVAAATIVLEAVRLSGRFGTLSFPAQTSRFLSRRPLAGEVEGRINVLLLGMRGSSSPASALTDSILFLSVYPDLQRAAVLPVPRDLMVTFPDGVRRKINHAYEFGEVGGRRRGLESTSTIVGGILGVPIHYAVVVDFAGFANLIDHVGGVWIDVERAFSDSVYRDRRTTGVRFSAGAQRMDGTRALQYARSRYGDHGEGSDFARSRRQQKLLVALRSRLLSWDVWSRPWVLHALAGDIAQSVRTNFEPWEAASLARLLDGVRIEAIPGSALVDVLDEARDIDGTYELVPRRGTFAAIQFRVRNLLVKPKLADIQQARAGECGMRRDATAPPAAVVPVPRSAWDDQPRALQVQRQEVHGIIIHHDAVDYPPEFSGEDKVRSLRRSVARLGWNEVPYHYCIDTDGRVFEGAPEETVTPSNTWHDAVNLLHIALLGNYSREEPTATQLQALIALVEQKAAQYDVSATQISLHSDLVDSTECPGLIAQQRLTPRPWCPPPAPPPER